MRYLVAGTALVGLAALTTLTGCRALNQSFSDSRTEQASITEVRIEGGSGAVTVEHSGTATQIDRTVYYDDKKPTNRFDRVEGSVLILNTTCARHACDIDYHVKVPSSVKITGRLDSGRIDVRDVTTATLSTDSGRVSIAGASGDVTATTDSGRIDANGIKGRVSLRTDSGSVHTSGVGGTLVVQTDSGSVRADGVAGGQTTVRTQSGSVAVDLVSEQGVKVDTDSGRIEVTVPRGGSYQVRGHSDSGSVKIEIPQSPTGTHLLDLNSDSGSIRVSEGTTSPVSPAASAAASAPASPAAVPPASPPVQPASPSPK